MSDNVEKRFETDMYIYILPTYTAYEDGTGGVLKFWLIKFRCRGVTQKKEYNIQNTVKV